MEPLTRPQVQVATEVAG